MGSLDVVRTIQIGNRSGNLQHTAKCTHTQAHSFHGHMEDRFCFARQCAVAFGKLCVKLSIAMNAVGPIPCLLKLAGFAHSLPNHGG